MPLASAICRWGQDGLWASVWGVLGGRCFKWGKTSVDGGPPLLRGQAARAEAGGSGMAPGCGWALVNTQCPEQAVPSDSATVWGTRSS